MPSAIEWTEDTLNVVTGCTKVSAGCANCYIERQPPMRVAGRIFRPGVGKTLSPDQPDDASPLRFHLERLDPMVRRRKPTMYFVNSMSDTFHEDVPDESIALLFAGMACAPQHTFQVLTKRPERMRELLSREDWPMMVARQVWEQEAATTRRHRDATWHRTKLARYRDDNMVLPHVWLGVTVENRSFTWRADLLRATPAAVRFLSCEPLLGRLVDQTAVCRTCRKGPDAIGVPGSVRPWGGGDGGAMCPDCEGTGYRDVSLNLSGIDWVIAGGESGPGARPCREEWLRELKQACFAAGDVCPACKGRGGSVEPTPGYGHDYVWCGECGSTGRVNRPLYFLKQIGGNPDKRGGDRAVLDGRIWHEMPPVHGPTPAQGSLLA